MRRSEKPTSTHNGISISSVSMNKQNKANEYFYRGAHTDVRNP